MVDLRLLIFAFFLLINLIVGFLLGYQTGEFQCRFDAYFKQSPPVSVTGQRLNPGQPTHSPPVAGAGGETG